MATSKLEIPHVEDEETFRALRLMLAKLNDVGGKAILDGQVVTAALTTAETEVRHKLGRKPQGYVVVGLSAAATVHGRSHTAKYLKLTASATCTADLWVF